MWEVHNKKWGGFHRGAKWRLPDLPKKEDRKSKFMTAWGTLTADPKVNNNGKLRTTANIVMYGEDGINEYENLICWGDTEEANMLAAMEKGDRAVYFGREESYFSPTQQKEYREFVVSYIAPPMSLIRELIELLGVPEIQKLLERNRKRIEEAPPDEFEAPRQAYTEEEYEQESDYEFDSDNIETPFR